MSESESIFDEELFSPSPPHGEAMTTATNSAISDESSSTSTGVNEPEPSDDIPEWKGVSMDEIRKGHGVYDFQELPRVCPSSNHTVLIALPLPACGPPKPYPAQQADKWCQGYVRMPHSVHSIYSIDQNNGNRRCRNRWEIIQESLLRSFTSTQQLETAILSYNHIYAERWDFAALHHFFSEVVDEEETNIFFEVLMPKIVQLALQLPILITGAVPLLKKHTNKSITLSQLQVASLLANALFCTFPKRNSTNPQSEYATYPYINFNRLFSTYKAERHSKYGSVMEKLKCLFHYFRRVTSKEENMQRNRIYTVCTVMYDFHRAAPEGVITIQRRYIPKQSCPRWDRQDQRLQPLHVTSKGTIETDGAGSLQVDFANKYLGGGVLGLGCVQEEIRFAICPELMVTMLVTEALDDTEALIVSGVERYSKYEGYSSSFKWMGDFVDETPRDSSGRRLTSIVAIDALHFKQPISQFSISNITRELNKAYVGFVGCERNRDHLPPIATGNWGCGAFHGNPKLKVLLQLMAAAVAGRSMIYFTFGDKALRNEIAEMYWHFVQHNIDIGQIFSLLAQYQESASRGNLDFYRFLYNRSKIKPLTKYWFSKNKSPSEKVSVKEQSVPNEYSWLKQIKSTNGIAPKNEKNFNFPVKQQNADEERIQSWLASCEDNSTNDEKPETPEKGAKGMTFGDVHKNNAKIEQTPSPDEDSAERRKKQSFWRLLEEKVQTKTVSERRLSGLELLESKQELTLELGNATCKIEAGEIATEQSTDSNKKITPVKKTGQRKISDFFQRTS